ncbi:hypothetical protein [Chitinilyticum litopenaei]|nr:hypothetical protein [Chitinilyticum litopenaei]
MTMDDRLAMKMTAQHPLAPALARRAGQMNDPGMTEHWSFFSPSRTDIA